MLVFVADNEADGRTRGLSLEQPREDFHAVAFLARRGQRALSRAAAVEFVLHDAEVYADACRHAVNHAADGRAVAFAERRQAEYLSKGVHGKENWSELLLQQQI